MALHSSQDNLKALIDLPKTQLGNLWQNTTGTLPLISLNFYFAKLSFLVFTLSFIYLYQTSLWIRATFPHRYSPICFHYN